LLHREHPERQEFTVSEILERLAAERFGASARPGATAYAYAHLVANRPPSPARYRMLFATGKNTRRLFRNGDESDPRRTGKSVPDPAALPPAYRYLLDWYRQDYNAPRPGEWLRGVFELIGAGRELFGEVRADEYVRQLREGWE
jgi:hypothetical protein